MSVSIARRASTMSGGSQQRQTTSQFESQRDEIKRRQSIKYQFPNFMFSEEEEAALFNEVKLIKLFHFFICLSKISFRPKRKKRKMKYIASNFYSCKYSAEPVVYEMHCDQLQMVYSLHPLFAENKIDIIIGFKTLSNGLYTLWTTTKCK